MAITTFSGPVRSLAGFITGTDAVIPAVTDATLAVTSDYNGEVIPLSRAAGMTVTLPAATGSQAVYRFLVSTTFTSSGIIKVANATDVMVGSLAVSATTGTTFSTLASSDTITMSGSTTGGLAGSIIELADIATGYWRVSGGVIGSGTAATPFSATV